MILYALLASAGCRFETAQDLSEPVGEAVSPVCIDFGATQSCGADLWPGNTISFVWGASLSASEKTGIRAAMDRWSAATSNAVQFVINPAVPHLTIESSSHGLTPIGAVGSNATAFMTTGNADHELGHAVGFFHAHQRPDRDRYLSFLPTFSSFDNVALVPIGDLCALHPEDNNSAFLRCGADSPSQPQAVGPFSFRSTMIYTSHEIIDQGTGQDTFAIITSDPLGNQVKPEDGSAALEMIMARADWSVFRPLDRSSVTWGYRDFTMAPSVTLVGSPALDSWQDGQLDVYARGSDNKLYQKYRSGGAALSDWGLLDNGPVGSSPAAVSWGTSRSDTVYVSTSGNVMLKTYAGGWKPTYSLGAPAVGVTSSSSPSIASWAVGRLDVFVRGTDNHLWVTSCQAASCLSSGSFSSWAVVPGGTFSGSPAAVARSPGLIEVFVHGMDDRLWMTSYTGAWNGYWAIPGGTLGAGSSPAVTSWSGHKLDVFVIGTDSRLWRNWWDGGSAWNGYEPMGGTLVPGRGVAVAARTTGDQVHVAASIMGADGLFGEGAGVWLRATPISSW